MKLATASEMQELDRTAIEKYHIPGMVLMEKAGLGTFSFMTDELGPAAGKAGVIFAGPGNNGGDGLVISRCIAQAGGFPLIIFLVPPEKLIGDAASNYRIVSELNIPSIILQNNEDIKNAKEDINKLFTAKSPWAIVDALFGTGLQRNLEGRFLDAVHMINTLRQEHSVPVTAVDMPSGINSDTGKILGAAVHADLTATYGLAKPGHFMHGGGPVGRLHIVDIGIPSDAVESAHLGGEALDRTILTPLTERKKDSHKGSYGHLTIIAGSEGKTGAAILSAIGALRSGVGLVSLFAPGRLNPIFETALPEAMTIPLPFSRDIFSTEDLDFILEQLAGKDALAIGPGLGTEGKTAELVIELYRKLELPMVVDADALNILAAAPDSLKNPPAPRILTPHPGEMARLTELTTKQIQEDRLAAASSFTASLNTSTENVTLVLKGAGTLICDAAGTWAVNTTGNPGMATGGMGDVLTGLTGGFLAQGVKPAQAARIAVYLHGLAADRLSKTKNFGYLASEVAIAVPELVTESINKVR